MNVLQINTVYPNGSTGRIAAQIAAYTAQQENAHAFVAFGFGQAELGQPVSAYTIGKPFARKVHGAIRKLFDAEGYGSRLDTRRLIRYCKRQQIDIVHLHNLHGCYLNLRLWFRYLQKANLPVIWTFHDCWPMTGHCAHFTYSGCEKWKTECNRCPQQKSYPVCIGLDGSRRNYRMKKRRFPALANLTIVAPCRWMEEVVRESYFRGTQVRLIYNGVDPAAFHPTASGIRAQYGLEDKKVLLAVASDWTERKGLRVLEALPALLDDTYRVVIVGLSEAQRDALPKSILGIGRTADTAELCAWYTAADCFVNPTLEDTMPLVNLEALACGTPLAVFDTGGCPEAVAEGCGIVVSRGDTAKLADAVRHICESGTDYTDACMAQVRRFTMQDTVRAYYALYQGEMQ